MSRFFNQVGFILRLRYIPRLIGSLRKTWLSFFGMKIGKDTILPKLAITWPHQVAIGKNCRLEKNILFKYDGIWKEGPSIFINDEVFIGTNCEFNIRQGIVIGHHSNIASGCRFIDHDHGKELNLLMGAQDGEEIPINIGSDVWLGCNVVVLKGVQIGDGAIVGAGAVVTKSIGANEIWAGVPAKKIGERK